MDENILCAKKQTSLSCNEIEKILKTNKIFIIPIMTKIQFVGF